jgi:WD40 repeat protein
MAAFDPAGDSVLTTSERGIQRWPLFFDGPGELTRLGEPEQLSPRLADRFEGCLSHDGRRLAVIAGPKEVLVFNPKNPGEKKLLQGHAGVSAVALSPDGRWAATSTQHGVGIKIWDVETGTVVRDFPAGGYAKACFSPDGRWLVTNDRAEGFQMRRFGSWESMRRLPREDPDHFVFAEDGKMLALSHSRFLVDLLDPVTGEELATWPVSNGLPISGLCFSPDGNQLAVSCYQHHIIQVWELGAIRRRLADMKLNWPE